MLKPVLTTTRSLSLGATRANFDRSNSREEMKAAAGSAKKAAEEQAKKNAAGLEAMEKEVAELEARLKAIPDHVAGYLGCLSVYQG